MREKDFPFRQFRDYGEVPNTLPDIPVDVVMSLSEELGKKKLIVVDDLTGSYRYRPVSQHGLLSYTGYYNFVSEAKKLSTKPLEPVTDILLDLEEKSRQVLHRASNLQTALGHFIFHSMRRERALDLSLSSFENHFVIRNKTHALHAAESIAELGHCMLQPFPGTMPSPKSERAKYSVGLAEDIQGFGSFATQQPYVLESDAGYALMLFSHAEQKRRLVELQPRYDLALKHYANLQNDFDFSTPLSDDQLFAVKFQ